MSITPRPWYREVSSLINARDNCLVMNNEQWYNTHTKSLQALREMLPSGAGIDSGCQINLDTSTPERLVIDFGFHYMDEFGTYTRWVDYTLYITPSLQHEFSLRIVGRDYNDTKEYLYDVFHQSVSEMVWQTEDSQWHSTPGDDMSLCLESRTP